MLYCMYDSIVYPAFKVCCLCVELRLMRSLLRLIVHAALLFRPASSSLIWDGGPIYYNPLFEAPRLGIRPLSARFATRFTTTPLTLSPPFAATPSMQMGVLLCPQRHQSQKGQTGRGPGEGWGPRVCNSVWKQDLEEIMRYIIVFESGL